MTQPDARVLIGDALLAGDKTQAQLRAELCLATSTVSRCLKALVADGIVYVCRVDRPARGPGPPVFTYRRGVKPRWFRPIQTRGAVALERAKSKNKAAADSRLWLNALAVDRDAPGRRPRRDPLTAAFFGSETT
ncbi:MAG: helix-turn-helix domain-containing protein [Hydrogenophaga sp.]|nr:helix-turn-helix domain-containing protein [Hydrogenophaga sp.]